MKKVFGKIMVMAAAVLAVAFVLAAAPMDAFAWDAPAGWLQDETVLDRIYAMQETYPDGYSPVTCGDFAFDVAAHAFPGMDMYMVGVMDFETGAVRTHLEPWELAVIAAPGDLVSWSYKNMDASHIAIILGVGEDGIFVAHGGVGGDTVRWNDLVEYDFLADDCWGIELMTFRVLG